MKKSRILVNASTLVVGGGVQIGKSFIEEACRCQKFDFMFLVSDGIYNNLSSELTESEKIRRIEIPPSRLFRGTASRKQIQAIERLFAPDLVYSLGFPSYIRFNSIEVGRYTNPWEINSPPLPWHTIPGYGNRVKTLLGILYRQMWARRADYLETQTEEAKAGIVKRLTYPAKRIKVVPNSPNRLFVEEGLKLDYGRTCQENMIFCLSAPYEHKNLNLIPHVVACLRQQYQEEPVFILTLPPESDIWCNISETAKRLGCADRVQNVGILKVKECIKYYQRAKIVFLPTLLEIFSATYLEAMAMKVPIVTTDLSFAHDNCKNAALFFKPGSPEDAAMKIAALLKNKTLCEQQMHFGERILTSYPSTEEKYAELFAWFDQIISAENKGFINEQ